MSVGKISSGECFRARKSANFGITRDFSEKFEKEETEDVGIVVERAEAMARENQRLTAKKSSKTISSKREYAQTLHQQADFLHHKGDYESALVLYHRAASAYPCEMSHAVAARRTAAVISSATNPAKNSRKMGAGSKKVAQLTGISCPETAAQKAQKIVEESADPISAIDQILKYFDSRKDFSKDPPIFRNHSRSKLISKSRVMLRELESLASLTLENLQRAWSSGDFPECWKIGNELLTIAEALIDRHRYEVAARHYLAMTQISLGRHDRAIEQATEMIQSAKKSADVSLLSRSFMTLGRVHLSFGHLDAAARAWERLLREIDEALPRAWLLHEIGRCHLEMKRPERALATADRCLEYADEANSRKWRLHGLLLRGQALVEIGRLGEAVIVLKKAHEISVPVTEENIRDYISEAIDRVTAILRRSLKDGGRFQEVVDSQDEDKDVRILQDPETAWNSEFFEKLVKFKGFDTWRKKSGDSDIGFLYPRSLRRNRRVVPPNRRRRMVPRMWNGKTRTRKKIGRIVQSKISIDPSGDSTESEEENVAECSEDNQEDELLSSRTRVIEQNREESNDWLDQFSSRIELCADYAAADEIEASHRTGKTYVLEELSLVSTERK